jgi:hypothetical protein
MALGKPEHLGELSKQISELYVSLEDLREGDSMEYLSKVLGQLRELCSTIDLFNQSATAMLVGNEVLPSDIIAASREAESRLSSPNLGDPKVFGKDPRSIEILDSRSHAPLIIGKVYTRNDLRELFKIKAAGLNNGVFRLQDRGEVWLFVTENKSADREQYIDKLVGNVLYWQGQRMGRTDSLIIGHKRNGESLLLFYRRAIYEFDGAGFRYEGSFRYIDHSGGQPTSFVLRRLNSSSGQVVG